ncbi:hypothetical protein B484DRAFT_391337, partial [Ochromonadaceae sp. CCMP2298]
TYRVAASEWFDPETKSTTALGLKERVSQDEDDSRLTKQQREQIESLRIVRAAGEDVEAAVALFHDIDADGSGELDVEEFGCLLQSMGIGMTPVQVLEVMSEYDVDAGGVIELGEFHLFLRHQSKDAQRKII